MKNWLYGRHSGWATILIGAFAGLTLFVVLCTIVGVIGSARSGQDRITRVVPLSPGAGTGSASASTARPFGLPVGSSVTVDFGFAGSAHRATLSKVEQVAVGCDDFAAKPNSGTYTLATVELAGIRGLASINPLYWSIVDKAGRSTDSLTGVMSGCQTLGSVNDLPAGMLRSGVVAFDAPFAAGSAIFYSSTVGTPQASWAAP